MSTDGKKIIAEKREAEERQKAAAKAQMEREARNDRFANAVIATEDRLVSAAECEATRSPSEDALFLLAMNLTNLCAQVSAQNALLEALVRNTTPTAAFADLRLKAVQEASRAQASQLANRIRGH